MRSVISHTGQMRRNYGKLRVIIKDILEGYRKETRVSTIKKEL